jgi:hypothetical protein
VRPLVDRYQRGPLSLYSPVGSDNVVVLEGVLREQDPAMWLGPIIDDIHRCATREGLRQVVLDLRGLTYANAAAWKCIVYWVRLLKEPSDKPYKLSILADEKHRWQQVGMTTLRVFSEERLEIVMYRDGQRL